MKPPGKTTLLRMQRTAMLEAERIEITQDYWVKEGAITEPVPYMVARRDDLVGVVRMIDAVNDDPELLDRIKTKMAAQWALAEGPAPAVSAEGDVAVDEDNSEASD